MSAQDSLSPEQEGLHTDIREVLEDRALHGQLVKICVQEGDDSLRNLILNHFGSCPELPVSRRKAR